MTEPDPQENPDLEFLWLLWIVMALGMTACFILTSPFWLP